MLSELATKGKRTGSQIVETMQLQIKCDRSCGGLFLGILTLSVRVELLRPKLQGSSLMLWAQRIENEQSGQLLVALCACCSMMAA